MEPHSITLHDVKFQKVLDVPTPQYHSHEAAGFDIAIAEDVTLDAGATTMVRTGLVIQAPTNHFLLLVPRSSTHKKFGVSLANTVGVVDRDYCGPEDEIKLALKFSGVINGFEQRFIGISKGTRLAQGLFLPVTHGKFIETEGNIAESRGGWGSTG